MWLPIGVALAWLPFRQNDGSLQVAVLILATILMGVLGYLALRFLTSFTRAGWSQSKLPVVRITGDLVTVLWNGETIESQVSDCNLRLGSIRHMKYATRKSRNCLFFERKLILIDLPPLYRDLLGQVRSYTTVAVGYTDESRRRWSDALGLQDGEPDDARESPS
ncbi:hypothetical protein TBK1r_66370 [Stieleria magnilauensis]|uniref:DUF304 domain-containing protein n=2 Tax=Stieleria magnilauensis TaxID=2527963 RepID=A0ABX5Y251_9BACT|nr:hypothetical protein TBK1r_66370 [Planctomycetes bacterium TBK1r]